jgi:release factor glutamine methyltransferase
VAAARERLRGAGIPLDEAEIDARLLAEHVLGWDTARYFASADAAPPADFAARYEPLVARRLAREPLAYITGRQEFWDLTFSVSPAVLIPRPESEIIVEAALELFPPDSAFSAADVGTGSGCLAIALAHERPGARVVATDVADGAMEMARRNAARHGVAERIQFVKTDLLESVAGPFDLVVSNPPYVPDADRATIAPEVRDHEPPIALFAGDDGLATIRRLINQATSRLRQGGFLIFELGFGQAERVAGLISARGGLTMVRIRPDLRGIPRTAVARRTDTADHHA